MKVYTKQGDKGYSSLFSGRRVMKSHELLQAYGAVDELNSFIGLCISKSSHISINQELHEIQHTLFIVGSMLASDGKSIGNMPVLNEKDVTFLEKAIDHYDESLSPLRNFILPGGSELISLSHICRTITRRAEREVVKLTEEYTIDSLLVVYLNRLSDYFFTLARIFAQVEGIEEVTWNSPSTSMLSDE